jgi:hypothetical protein
MKIRSWLALGGFAVLSTAACSSTPAADKYPDVDSFCTEVANQQCQVAAKCAATMADCLTARKTQCTSDATAETTTTRQYRSGNAQACIDKTTSTFAMDGTITPAQLTDLANTCGRVFQGTAMALAACTTDFDCSGSLICDKMLCAPANPVAKGAGCASAGDQCATGSYCSSAGAASVCVAKGATGDMCSAALPCSEDLRCNNVCGPRFDTGTACASNDDCASTAPYCDPAINKCDAGLIFAPGAAACKATATDKGFGG